MTTRFKRELRRYAWMDFARDAFFCFAAIAFMFITVLAIFLLDQL